MAPHTIAGRMVRIDTSSMKVHEDTDVPYRSWKLVGDDLKWLNELANNSRLCEHLLEMD